MFYSTIGTRNVKKSKKTSNKCPGSKSHQRYGDSLGTGDYNLTKDQHEKQNPKERW
jgi:hypothetical protein